MNKLVLSVRARVTSALVVALVIGSLALTACGAGGSNTSCSPNFSPSNSYGRISAQQRGRGYGIQWGVYPNTSVSGTFTVDIYMSGRRVDHKVQNYPPHGSVNASNVHTGDIFRLDGNFSDGRSVQTFWLECRAA
jgi:hypothetical protein